MLKNRLSVVLIVTLVFVGGFFAVNSGLAQAVQVPAEINLWLVGITFAFVTAGLDWVFNYTGLDLRGLSTELAGVLSGWIVLQAQNIINLIPAAYDGYVSFVFTVLVVLLGGIGALRLAALASNGDRELLPNGK